MRVEYEKLFSTPDDLVDFLCKSNGEQNEIVAQLLAANKEVKTELFCHLPGRGDGDRT